MTYYGIVLALMAIGLACTWGHMAAEPRTLIHGITAVTACEAWAAALLITIVVLA
jgi:hypothetical protein